MRRLSEARCKQQLREDARADTNAGLSDRHSTVSLIAKPKQPVPAGLLQAIGSKQKR
jgi:hypothetical protein